jgi:ABC-type sugar transport system ATPase subunit
MNREVVLEARGLTKRFGGIVANHNIDMKLYEREIIAIVGDNGAGKSTLIKAISGIYEPDGGEIYIRGEKAAIHNPIDAKNYGIETVYQDEGLIRLFNPSMNLFLGRERLRKNVLGKLFRLVDYKYMRNETEKLLERIDIRLKDINAEVSALSGGQRQSVVVGRAVYWGSKIIILDEPTNNLGVKEERKIIDLIKNLRDKHDMSVIVISHNINHVFELVDRIIVLRNGEKVGERLKNETNINEIVSMITGVAE